MDFDIIEKAIFRLARCKKGKNMANRDIRKSRNSSIANEYLSGDKQQTIADRHNMSPSNVSRILSSDQVKDIIQAGIQEQIDMIPEANEVVKSSMRSPKDGKLRLDAAKTVLRNTGISPTHARNIHIDKMVQQNTQINEAAEIEGLQEFMKWRFSQDNANPVTGDKDRLEPEQEKTD